MKKLHKLIVPNIIAVLLAFLLASAQDKPAVPEPELTEVETLKLSGLLKDVQLAEKDVQLARMQFLSLSQILAVRQQTMNNEVEQLRVVHTLPAGEFIFDVATLTFKPVPKEQGKKE